MANFADLWEETPIDKTGGLQGDFANRIQAANQAWMAKTGKPLPINSGARTAEEGIKLWGQRASNPNLVAKPGTSLHERGAAADIPVDVPDSFLAEYGLHRPFGKKDPVHVEANPSYVPKQTATKPTAETGNFADLWDATPASATGTIEKPKTMKEAMTSAQSTYKPLVAGAASLGDVILGAVPAIAGQATYAGARAFQKSPEEAQALAQKVSEPLTNPLGKALGVTQEPAYQNEATRRAMNAIGQYIGESADSISQKTGIPKADVENMIQTLTLAAPEVAGRVKGAAPQLKAQFEKSFPRFEEPTQPGANIGAAQVSKETVLQDAIQRATPELKTELQKLKPEQINEEVLGRQLEADSLPVPMKLTEGQATRSPQLFSEEMNSRGKNPELATRFNEQNAQLKENIDLIKDKAAPDVYGTNHVENGQSLIDAYLDIDRAKLDNINAKYEALREAAGGDFPIDSATFANNAFKQLKKELKTDFLPPAIEKQLKAYQAGEPMTFEQFEAMRTNLAAEMRKADRAGDGNAEFALKTVRQALEDLPLTGEAKELKPLADEARAAAKARFDTLDADKAYKAAVNGKVQPDDFIQKFVINGKKKDIDTMVAHLGADSQARQVMAAGVVNWLKSKAGILPDGSGNFSQKGFNQALNNIDPKILAIVGPEVNAQLKALGNTARSIQERPAGAFVNESNTFTSAMAEKGKKVAEAGLNYAIGGNVVPVGTIARNVIHNVKQGQKTKESLKPGAGIKLKDIGKE